MWNKSSFPKPTCVRILRTTRISMCLDKSADGDLLSSPPPSFPYHIDLWSLYHFLFGAAQIPYRVSVTF